MSEELELTEYDEKSCFQSYLSLTHINDEIIVFHNSTELNEECNNTVIAETEKFHNNLLRIIESEPKVKKSGDCKGCMMKFIEDFKVSVVALKDKTYDDIGDTILNKDITNFLLRLSYFYCYPNDLITILFEMDFEIGHWKYFSLKIVEKEICLLLDEIIMFDVSEAFTLSTCQIVLDQQMGRSPEPMKSIVNELLLLMFPQRNQNERQALATIKSCLMSKFEEKGYIDNTTSYRKINRQNCYNVYKPIEEAAKTTFKIDIMTMFMAKLVQCYLYDIMSEDFLYESLFHIMQPEFIAESKKKAAEENVIIFVKTTLNDYINCLIHVEWKIETILVLYKYVRKSLMHNLSKSLE